MLRRRILTKSTGRLMNFMKKNKQKMSQNWELGVCLFFLLVFFERPPNLRLKNTGLRQAALRKIKSVCWFTLCPIKKGPYTSLYTAKRLALTRKRLYSTSIYKSQDVQNVPSILRDVLSPNYIPKPLLPPSEKKIPGKQAKRSQFDLHFLRVLLRTVP